MKSECVPLETYLLHQITERNQGFYTSGIGEIPINALKIWDHIQMDFFPPNRARDHLLDNLNDIFAIIRTSSTMGSYESLLFVKKRSGHVKTLLPPIGRRITSWLSNILLVLEVFP